MSVGVGVDLASTVVKSSRGNGAVYAPIFWFVDSLIRTRREWNHVDRSRLVLETDDLFIHSRSNSMSAEEQRAWTGDVSLLCP